MRHPSSSGGHIRFQSREYLDALKALRAGPLSGATVITLSGGTQTELRTGAEEVARSLGRQLFRVNLAGVVSKYIGETEKNLSMLLARAQATDAVLFFEDADALFGRGGGQGAGDGGLASEAGTMIVEKIGTYRGFVVAALRQPPAPAPAHRKVRRIHVTLPPA